MTDYWNTYYKTKKKQITVPSQFAAFAIQEFGNQEDTIIIDLGCGDGRDSYFFSSHGFQTIGIDGSLEAINNCKQNFNHDLLDFFCYDIEEQSLYEKIKEIITSQNKKLVFYSRFFLHAINDNQQNILLNNLKNIMPKDSLCFFEFRTNRDEFQEKITLNHYRRYLSPMDFTVEVTRIGFDILYFVEGFGYAKYRKDDAHIARFILKTN